VIAAAGCKRDKQMAAIMLRMRAKNMPPIAEIRAKSADFLK